MKIGSVFIAGFFFCCVACKSQWFPVNQDTTFKNAAIFFLNADTGFVVGASHISQGDYGVISRTKNGGLSWDTLSVNFYTADIHFPSTNVGYTGGQDGVVYKTTDMGNTWSQVAQASHVDYSNCYFFAPDTGLVSNWFGQIFQTTSGGSIWNLDTNIGGYSPYPGLGSIQFINDSLGVIAAGQYGTYARSIDKGATWQVGQVDSNVYYYYSHEE